MALSSLLTVAVLAVLDRPGRPSGRLAVVALCLYTLLSSNLDFWDFYWVATERPGLIFVYTSVRLGTRVAVVLATAALTHDVQAIIWALIVLEGVRVWARRWSWRPRTAARRSRRSRIPGVSNCTTACPRAPRRCSQH